MQYRICGFRGSLRQLSDRCTLENTRLRNQRDRRVPFTLGLVEILFIWFFVCFEGQMELTSTFGHLIYSSSLRQISLLRALNSYPHQGTKCKEGKLPTLSEAGIRLLEIPQPELASANNY